METGRHSIESEEEKKRELGLHTISHGFNKEIEQTITKLVDSSLRSGKKIEFEGTLVILGDVNPGAEVIAEEHIIIMGTLRGLAHAGAKGNRKAMVVAYEIDAPQIRIADIVKEIEKPRYSDEEEIIEDKKNSKKKEKKEAEDEPIEYNDYYDVIKTRAFVKDNVIVLE